MDATSTREPGGTEGMNTCARSESLGGAAKNHPEPLHRLGVLWGEGDPEDHRGPDEAGMDPPHEAPPAMSLPEG